jgi:hypothetical protein
MLASLCRCLIYWGWIGLAAWALTGWGEVDPTRSAMFMVGGWLAVAAAQGYRWYVIRQVQAISKSVSQRAEVQLVRP